VARERLTDWELASRLSYFLWNSMPDEGLFNAAQNGTLCTTDFQSVESEARRTEMSVLLSQEVDRMLTDSRINRFIDDFSRQWLQLHRVGMFPPDKKLYPRCDEWLETSTAPSGGAPTSPVTRSSPRPRAMSPCVAPVRTSMRAGWDDWPSQLSLELTTKVFSGQQAGSEQLVFSCQAGIATVRGYAHSPSCGMR